MKLLSIYKTIYFLGIVLIFIGGYGLFKSQSWGEIVFSPGIVMYSGIQIILLFLKRISDWNLFEYLKLGVNLLFLVSVAILFLEVKLWYYPFVLGLLVDFFANILKRIKISN